MSRDCSRADEGAGARGIWNLRVIGCADDLFGLDNISHFEGWGEPARETDGQKPANVTIAMLIGGVCRDATSDRSHSGDRNHNISAFENIYLVPLRVRAGLFPAAHQGRDFDLRSGDDDELRHICSP